MMQKWTSIVSSEKTPSKSTGNSEGGFLGHCASGPVPSTSQNRDTRNHCPTSSRNCQPTHAHAASDLCTSHTTSSGSSYGRSLSGAEHFLSNPGVESLAKRVETYLSEGTPERTWHMCRAYYTPHADSDGRASPSRVPKPKVNPAGGAPCAQEIGVNTSAPLVWWRLKDIFVETPSGGQPSGGAPPGKGRGEMPAKKSWKNEKSGRRRSGSMRRSDWRRGT